MLALSSRYFHFEYTALRVNEQSHSPNFQSYKDKLYHNPLPKLHKVLWSILLDISACRWAKCARVSRLDPQKFCSVLGGNARHSHKKFHWLDQGTLLPYRYIGIVGDLGQHRMVLCNRVYNEGT